MNVSLIRDNLNSAIPIGLRDESFDSDNTNQIVLDIFKKTLLEVSVVTIVTCVTINFSVTPLALPPLIFFAAGLVAVNALFRIVDAYSNYHKIKDDHNLSLIGIIPSINFSQFYQATGGVLLHEFGHSALAALLFKNPHVKIMWTSLFNGATSYSIRSLSYIGNVLGLRGSVFCVALFGSLAGVIAATAAIVAGLWLRKLYPELSSYFQMIGIAAITHHALYALSAFTVPMNYLSHDFVMLWGLGLHPFAAVVAIVGLPIIASLGYLALEQKIKTSSYDNQVQKANA